MFDYIYVFDDVSSRWNYNSRKQRESYIKHSYRRTEFVENKPDTNCWFDIFASRRRIFFIEKILLFKFDSLLDTKIGYWNLSNNLHISQHYFRW